MEIIKKIVRLLDRLEDFAVFATCLILMMIGMYSLYDGYLTYQHANDDSLLKYKPGYEKETEAERDFQGNMVAWLSLKDTSIDFPIMQGKTNTEYLNKDPYGDYSLSGSIFLDYRNASDFSDPYSLIYGHHMEGNVMFGSLDKYLDKTYFDEHKKGELFLNGKPHTIQIFAVVETEATNDAVFAPSETDVSKTWDFIKSHATYLDEEIEETGSLLALSTCKYPDTAERTVIFGILK